MERCVTKHRVNFIVLTFYHSFFCVVWKSQLCDCVEVFNVIRYDLITSTDYAKIDFKNSCILNINRSNMHNSQMFTPGQWNGDPDAQAWA